MTTDSTSLKRCTKCGNEYPTTSEYFPSNSRHSSGYNSWCRVCYRKKTKEYNAANPQANRQRVRKWRIENPDKKKVQDRLNRSKNRAACRTRANRYTHKHREELREKNRQWRKDNPEKSRMGAIRRRSRLAQLSISFTAKDWKLCLGYWNYRCAICGRPKGLWHTLAQDHWIPLIKGGAYIPENIVPLCHGQDGCNNSKNDNDPVEWLIGKFGASRAKAILSRIQYYFDSLKRSK